MKYRFSWCVGLALLAIGGCVPRPTVSPTVFATISACPTAETAAVWGPYSPECVKSLFRQSITLPSGIAYQSRSFQITTPADPQQLVATYVGTGKHGGVAFSIDIDPIGVNRVGPIVDRALIGSLQVTIATGTQAAYERFYWEWNGWWYTLQAPNSTPEDRDYDLSIIETMTRR